MVARKMDGLTRPFPSKFEFIYKNSNCHDLLQAYCVSQS
jgi:hypothetical protein